MAENTVKEGSGRVCPVARAGSLDSRVRRWLQNPRKILRPYIEEGMTVLDLGCGPGFFSADLARLVGASGRVIAADLQEGMLRKVREKIEGTDLEQRISLHRCEMGRTGVAGPVDFVLLFYVVHEVPDKEGFFREIATMVIEGGKVLVVEPPFHVSRAAFAETLRRAEAAGFRVGPGPKVRFSKAALLTRG